MYQSYLFTCAMPMTLVAFDMNIVTGPNDRGHVDVACDKCDHDTPIYSYTLCPSDQGHIYTMVQEMIFGKYAECISILSAVQ